MTPSMLDAIQRLAGERSHAFRDLEAALELEDCEWRRPPCGVALTETLSCSDARALFLAIARGKEARVLTPILIGDEGIRADYFVATLPRCELDSAIELHGSGEVSLADSLHDDAEKIERMRVRLTAFCDRIEAKLGRSIDDLLDRIDPDALSALEDDDDEDGLEPDDDLPNDPAERYARGRAERSAFVEEARKTHPAMLVRADPLRAFDLASALDEMALGPSRVAVLDCEAHLAPLYLGFGPEPHVHPRVWAHWAARWGARPIAFNQASLYGFVARPPTTVREHIQFFAEQSVYNPDTRVDGPLAQLGAAYRSTLIGFWWD